MRIGSPITGYGQESRNRAARQRIPNRTWTDEDGVEHVEVTSYWHHNIDHIFNGPLPYLQHFRGQLEYLKMLKYTLFCEIFKLLIIA